MKALLLTIIVSFSLAAHADISNGSSYLTTEDRGDVIVYTRVETEAVSATETCSKVTKTVVDKATQEVLSEEQDQYCSQYPL